MAGHGQMRTRGWHPINNLFQRPAHSTARGTRHQAARPHGRIRFTICVLSLPPRCRRPAAMPTLLRRDRTSRQARRGSESAVPIALAHDATPRRNGIKGEPCRSGSRPARPLTAASMHEEAEARHGAACRIRADHRACGLPGTSAHRGTAS